MKNKFRFQFNTNDSNNSRHKLSLRVLNFEFRRKLTKSFFDSTDYAAKINLST